MRGVHLSRCTQLKDGFLFEILWLSVFLWSKDNPEKVTLWWEWLGRLKWLAAGLDVYVSFFSTSRRFSRKRSANLLSVSPM